MGAIAFVNGIHTVLSEAERQISDVSRMSRLLTIFRSIFQVSYYYTGNTEETPLKNVEGTFLGVSSACSVIHSLRRITSSRFIKDIQNIKILNCTQTVISVFTSVKIACTWLNEQKILSKTLRIFENKYINITMGIVSSSIGIYKLANKAYSKGLLASKVIITRLLLSGASTVSNIALSYFFGSEHISLVIAEGSFATMDLGLDIASHISKQKRRGER